MSSLGKRLKMSREKTHLTQQQVADKMGISNGTLSGYERDYRDPDTDTLNKLSSLYEVSVDYLLGRTDKKENPDQNEPEFLKRLDMDDEKLFNQYQLFLDGKPLDHEATKIAIAFLRTALSSSQKK